MLIAFRSIKVCPKRKGVISSPCSQHGLEPWCNHSAELLRNFPRGVSKGSVTFIVAAVLPSGQGDTPERVTGCHKTSWAWVGLGMGTFVTRSSYYKGIFFLSPMGSKVRLNRTVRGCKLFRNPRSTLTSPNI